MARNKISLSKCYDTLQVLQNASINEVKHAYRKRAFELHPDLNPNNSSSHVDFQNLNEAYVTIIEHLDIQEKKISTKNSFFASKTKKQNENSETEKEKNREEELKVKKKQETREQEYKERQEREKQADERRRTKERAEHERAQRTRLREQIEKDDAKRKIAKEEEKRKAERETIYKARLIKEMEEEAIRNKNLTAKKERESTTRAYSNFGKPIFDQKKYHGSSKGPDSYNASNQFQDEQASQTSFAYDAKMREQILQELLEDNYARKVYEDIYHELNVRKNEKNNSVKSQSGANEKKNTNNNINQSTINETGSVQNKHALSSQALVIKGLTGQIATGIKDGVSSWLKNQIDDELELFFPASKLIAGARMRLQIRSGWSGELQTIEVKLPADFVPGKPFRLKGMGKKIGKWQGDLYLKLQKK